ncbi:MAG: glycosyltransferase [Phycisphaerae bacterium]|nr:glycosyltransferase [Phycisphaerae bacterium]
MRVTVVIPAYNAVATVAEAVRAVVQQVGVPADQRECIVASDASSDGTDGAARAAGATVVRLPLNRGCGAARNAGIRAARGRWIAFTDADCVPSRRWLAELLSSAERADRRTLGVAGRTVGLESATPAARFMDLIGALDAENYVRHAVSPWAPSCNLAYRREDLLAVGGFDPSMRSYETCELHRRLVRAFGGGIELAPRAVVMHRHRATWAALWRQQLSYGRGHGEFLRRHSEVWPWSRRQELGAWARTLGLAVRAAASARGDEGLVRRGLLVKHLAQRIGFAQAYFGDGGRP